MFVKFTEIWLNWNIELTILFGISCILLFYLFNWFLKYNSIDIIFISIYLSLIMLYMLFRADSLDESYLIFNNYFICSEFYNLIKKVIIISLFFYLIILYNFNKIINIPVFEYLILIFSSIFSILIIIKSNHLFIIFLFLEVLNLCVYCLIALNKNSNMGIESAYKYFTQSSFLTIIGFFGLSLIYISAGTLFLHELGTLIYFNQFNLLFIIGIYLIIMSVFFKLGVFPLHSWIADVYQGALLISLIFISIIPKIAYIILFLKIYMEFNMIIQNYCLIVAVLSIIYGSLVSLYQTSFKRLLGYGSMVHIGLIILSISIFNIYTITAGIFYLFIYIILMFFTFSFMLFLFEKNNSNIYYIDEISQFHLYFSNNIILTVYFSFILFSLAGLPFFIGFIAKWYIFVGLIDSFYIFDVLILLSISVLSSSYYIRILRFFYFSYKTYKVKRYSIISFDNSLYNLIVFLFIINLFTVICHNIIFLILFKCLLLL